MNILQASFVREVGPGQSASLDRGQFSVCDDGRYYIYRRDGHTISDIRRAVKNVYVDSPNYPRRLTGRYPRYEVRAVL